MVFVELPGFKDPVAKTPLERRSMKYINGPKHTYAPLTLEGTTFSGDPITTLGNTLRSICYAEYYMRHIPKTQYRLFAAGDDVMIIVSREWAKTAKRHFLAHTARQASQPSALG